MLGQQGFSLLFQSEELLNEAATTFRDHILETTGGKVIAETILATLEPQASVVVIDQHTGYVKAVSGGRGDKDKMGSLILNRATQSTRQPGSTSKILFTYAPAIDLKGATLATTVYDSAMTVEGRPLTDWWGDRYPGYINIRQAIMASSNIVAVKTLENLVTENLAYEYARAFGITTLIPQDKSPVMTLGGLAYGVTNLELTAGYAAIANNGKYVEPIFWTRVTDLEGRVLLENEQTTRTVIKSDTAKLLTSAMESTISPPFLSMPSIGIGAPNQGCQVKGVALAAKSGTTNDVNDLWLVGYSPAYTVGVWCGFDESMVIGEGANFHRSIWTSIMERVHKETEVGDVSAFDYSGLVKLKICSKSGLLAKEGVCDECGDADCHIYEEYFTSAAAPKDYCNRHTVYHVCTESEQLAGIYCPERFVEDRVYFVIDPMDQDGVETHDIKNMVPGDLIGTVCDIHDEFFEDTEEEEEEALPLNSFRPRE